MSGNILWLLACIILGFSVMVAAYSVVLLLLSSASLMIWRRGDNTSWLSFLFFPIRHILGKVGDESSRFADWGDDASDVLLLLWPIAVIWNITFVILLSPVKLWRQFR